MNRVLIPRSLQWVQVRFKYRGNKQRPDKLFRRVLTEVTRPVHYDEIHHDDIDMCSISKYRREQRFIDKNKLIDETQYEQFLVRELKKEMVSIRLIAICQIDSMGLVEKWNLKNPFLDEGLIPLMYPAEACVKMLSASKYQNIAPLVNEHSIMVVGHSENLAKALIKVIKNLPSVHLLGGVVGDTIMTKQALIKYAGLPDLDTCRSQLLSTLNYQSQSLKSSLNYQQVIVRSLAHYIEREKV